MRKLQRLVANSQKCHQPEGSKACSKRETGEVEMEEEDPTTQEAHLLGERLKELKLEAQRMLLRHG